MPPRSLIVTGASGFVGRHLLDAIKDEFTIWGFARRSQAHSGAPVHPNIRWVQVDVADRPAIEAAFQAVRSAGGAEAVIHLAAHYDFTGEADPEYWRTNVDGLRNVLEATRGIGIRAFIFSSSVAACRFPAAGRAVDETSPPDGREVYSVTKALGERLLSEYDPHFKSIIVRFAALFSDWCEYPPLFATAETWLSHAWTARFLAGRGRSALPYLHVREVAPFVRRVLDRFGDLAPREVLLASVDGAVSHRELYEAVLTHVRGEVRSPIGIPRWACGPGIRLRGLVGQMTGHRPFERAWMARYIDRALTVDASRTRARLGWAPRERLQILRRMPFLAENLKRDPYEWHRRNRQAMDRGRVRRNLRIHALLETHEEEISRRLTAFILGPEGRGRFPHYQHVDFDRHHWHHGLALRHLMNAVRTRERGIFLAYCQDLASRRRGEGFPAEEVHDALESLGRIAAETIAEDPNARDLAGPIHDEILQTARFGADHVLDVYEEASEKAAPEADAARAGSDSGVSGTG